METQIGLKTRSPVQTALHIAESRLFKAVVWAGLCSGVFMIVNGNLLYYFGYYLTSEIRLQDKLLLENLATNVVASYCPIAIVYGIICGVVLAKSKRLPAWLAVMTLLVFTTGILNLCQMLAYR